MKKAILLLVLLLSTYKTFGMDGEIWFKIDDNTGASYYVKAVRISNNDPLFGANFMEVDTDIYNVVISDYDAIYHEPVDQFEKLRGFNFLRDVGAFPAIGEGKIRFEIYRSNVKVFSFSVDLVHSIGSPDLTFEYYYSTNSLIGKGNGPNAQTIQVYDNDFINCWNLLGQVRDISSYTNQVTLTNLLAGSVENNIKTTFNTALMGFPYNNVQLGVQYNPGTTVSLWRGVYYNISASHTSYVKNGLNYNFRNWGDPYTNSYSSNSIFKIQANTSELRSMYYQTQPLTVLNSLEGGSTNNNFNIIWQNPNPDITTVWQYGSAYNTFNYQSPILDLYSIEAPSMFQSLNTTWWFYNWDDGSSWNIKPNIQVTAPTTITAYYKGHLRSNSTTGISSNSQRKMVRTDNGIYHVVYESMGNVFYTHSLTSNFDGEWAAEQIVYNNAKNPAIEFNGNIVKIVLEYYEPVYSAQVDLWLLTFTQQPNGIYENSAAEVFTTCLSSYFGNAKPVISYNDANITIVYRKNSTEGLKEKTKWYYSGQWTWTAENNISETDANSINPAIIGSVGNIHIAFESLGTIKYKFGGAMGGNGPWRYNNLIHLSTGSGYTTNNYPSISLCGYSTPYVMVSWHGNFVAALEKQLAKENDYSDNINAAVAKVGYSTSWGGFSSFSNNVFFTNNNSLNTSLGSILTWSESNGINGPLSKYVRRKSNGTYDPISSLSANGIQTLVCNGSAFDNMKAMVFNTSTPSPYLLNKCADSFPLNKVGKTETVDISYGRSGVVEKNGIEFLFSIGDVQLDGQTIIFVERIDTLPVTNLDELNTAARTESFNLSQQSELIFSNYYYVVNKNLADSLLSDEFSVTLKCELVNASTNQAVGTFDNVTYNKLNVQEYNNQSYLIDCSGIETGNYYLKLTTAVNDSVNLFISDIQRNDIILEKSNLIVRNFKGEGVLVEYDLAQNFPNPFNPNTTIRYQIPQDGIVTLKIYDILGSEITTLVNEDKPTGIYEVSFNASNLSSGVYFYRISAGDFNSTKKMILIK